MGERITASEAVYGFAAWLAGRKDPVTISSEHDAAIVCDLVKTWCDVNELDEPREGVYPGNIVHPVIPSG